MLLPRWKYFHFSIRTMLLAVFLFSTFMTALVAIGMQYYFSRNIAREAALSDYEHTVSNSRDYLAAIDKKAEELILLLSKFPQLINQTRIPKETRHLFTDILERNPLFFNIMVGFSHGEFYQLINLHNSAAQLHQLTRYSEDKWLVIKVKRKNNKQEIRFDYYDEQFSPTHSKKGVTRYDIKTRPWFINAKEAQVRKTTPYLFQHVQLPGQSYYTKIGNGAVLAMGIALPSVSEFLQQQSLGHGSELYIYRKNGELIASNIIQTKKRTLPASPIMELTEKQQTVIKRHPVLTVSNEIDWAPINFAVSGQPQGYSIDVLNYISAMTGFKLRFVNGLNWHEMTKLFLSKELDIIQPVFYTSDRKKVGLLSKPFLDVPYGMILRADSPEIKKATDLTGKRIAIPKNWSLITRLKKYFPDIHIVEVDSIEDMFSAVQQGQVYAGIDTAVVLQNFKKDFFIQDVVAHPVDFSPQHFPTSLHFLINLSQPEVARIIDQALQKLGGKYQSALKNKWFNFDIDHKQMMGTVPYPELIQLSQEKSKTGKLQRITIHDKPYFIYIAPIRENDYLAIITPEERILSIGLEKVKTSLWITVAMVVLLFPFIWFLASPIARSVRGLLEDSEKIKQRKFSEIKQVESTINEINELANSMLTMSQSIAQHEIAQQELIEAFIELIAQAIDEKSPYTGGHCERVPELAQMLAQAANNEKEGAFSEFSFKNENEWREFRIAAWLHDCGKITTPVHIIDKGTKLECIYNRIHEIRMRFEVLWRDAEIKYLQQCAEFSADSEALAIAEKKLKQTQKQLQDDFAFIAQCNIGGEYLNQSDVERLEVLAQKTWERHFDDHLGLSPVEEQRYQWSKELPVTEYLLSDKKEHIIERTQNTDYDPGLGIKMTIPKHLYNLGELYNLKVSRGTLTVEDRFKINEHMISTIKMLEKLPFPPELSRVPRYATTHHETMNGTGYPRKLSAKDLSIPERIMVVADIFEALTAADRPYKKAKPVSQAVDILHKMVLKKQVDRHVFELFLTSGVYLQYARQFLPASQIDEVDIRQYLAN